MSVPSLKDAMTEDTLKAIVLPKCPTCEAEIASTDNRCPECGELGDA